MMYIERYWEIEFSLWRTSSKDSFLTKRSSGIQVNTGHLSSVKYSLKQNTNRKCRNKSKDKEAADGLINYYYKTLQKTCVFHTGGSYKG